MCEGVRSCALLCSQLCALVVCSAGGVDGRRWSERAEWLAAVLSLCPRVSHSEFPAARTRPARAATSTVDTQREREGRRGGVARNNLGQRRCGSRQRIDRLAVIACRSSPAAQPNEHAHATRVTVGDGRVAIRCEWSACRGDALANDDPRATSSQRLTVTR